MGLAAADAAASRELGETENGIFSPAYLTACQNPTQPTTSIDVLEIREEQWPHKTLQESLDHDALVRRFKRLDDYNAASLLVLFINTIPTPQKDRTVLVSAKTLTFLRKHFGVSLLFLVTLGPFQWGPKSGNACFNLRESADMVIQIDAYHSFLSEDGPCDIWVRNHPSTRKTTYIISNCSTKAKSRIMECANGKDCLSLLRSMMIDTFLADAALEGLKANLQSLRGTLMAYENHGASQLPTELVQDTFQKLHQLSQKWHILHEMLRDNEQALKFVRSINRPC